MKHREVVTACEYEYEYEYDILFYRSWMSILLLLVTFYRCRCCGVAFHHIFAGNKFYDDVLPIDLKIYCVRDSIRSG